MKLRTPTCVILCWIKMVLAQNKNVITSSRRLFRGLTQRNVAVKMQILYQLAMPQNNIPMIESDLAVNEPDFRFIETCF